MAWNGDKMRYECDRCGKPITRNQMLCKECDTWLTEYVKRQKEGKDDK